ncbi:uncharacterized protein K02A2.6-like [Armigeres subalbatus]|uniref:uncharacterized protein K02A2.6-like n=1 Tax=Armigeres subalbatus TaxID=124917 RepID=UPI002ED37A11
MRVTPGLCHRHKGQKISGSCSDDRSLDTEGSGHSCGSKEESFDSSDSDSPDSPITPNENNIRADPNATAESSSEKPKWSEYEAMKKIENLQKTMAELTERLSTYERPGTSTLPDVDKSWGISQDYDRSTGNTNIVRWDHITPFPSGVPACKMWEEWNRFLQNFEIAASLGNVVNSAQRSKLLFLCLGQELQGIVRAARLLPNLTDPNCYSVFVNNVQGYLQSMPDTAAEHEAFAAMKQEPKESAVAFHARLQEKVQLCGYSLPDQGRFVRAQLLKGLRNRDLTKTARIYNYDINFIVQSATREEAYMAETTQHAGSEISAVHRGNWKQPMELQRKRKRNDEPDDRHESKRYRGPDKRREGRNQRCKRCNRPSHRSSANCPALNKNCNGCGERGHFIATCRKRRVSNVQREADRANPPGWTDEEEEEDKKKINALSLNDVLVDCSIGSSSPITFMIDSGADVNVIGGNDWTRLKRAFHGGHAKLHPVPVPSANELHAYGSRKPITINAAFKAEICVPGTKRPSIETTFYVANEGGRSLLGRSAASDMSLLHVGIDINNCGDKMDKQEFPKVPGIRIKFSVDKKVSPVKNAYYNVPAAFRDGARNRVLDMENRGIIERVTKAPNWISGMSAVAKGKDDFRLVVNMRGPNKAINREYYRLPLLEEMKVKLHGARYFSKLDLSNAYYHLELCEESRDLTTFLTEMGMFRFTRLMFGVNCAPEIFQREMVRILEGVENLIVYIDDILMFAATIEELHTTVAQVLRILRAHNLTVNENKCEFDRTRLKFLGHELDKDGFHIEEAKVKSIRCFSQAHCGLQQPCGTGGPSRGKRSI